MGFTGSPALFGFGARILTASAVLCVGTALFLKVFQPLRNLFTPKVWSQGLRSGSSGPWLRQVDAASSFGFQRRAV